MSPAARDKRERFAKWLYMRFLGADDPKSWEALFERQRNYWRKLADEGLTVAK